MLSKGHDREDGYFSDFFMLQN